MNYLQAHKNVYQMFGRPDAQLCIICGERAAQWAYNHKDPDERVGSGTYKFKYSTDPRFYDPLCVSCHRKRDYRENPESRLARVAQLAAAREQPAFKAASSRAMQELNLKFRRCSTCGLVSRPGGLGRHLKAQQHEGWEPA